MRGYVQCVRRVLLVAAVASVLPARAQHTPTERGPVLVSEPASMVPFGAGAGARMTCAARGHPAPAVSWLAGDGTPLTDAPPIRRVFPNGTLVVLPSRDARDTGPRVVRCRATNARGTVLSRPVTLQPVWESSWQARVVDGGGAGAGAVAAGAARALLCEPPAQGVLWYHDGAVLPDKLPGDEDMFAVSLGDTLVVIGSTRSVGAYECLIRPAFGAARRSQPYHLTLLSSEESAGMQPGAEYRNSAEVEYRVSAGAAFCLPCGAALPYHAARYTWRRRDGAATTLRPWRGGAALCAARADPGLAAAYECRADGAPAGRSASLVVIEPLHVTLTPQLIMARRGEPVTFSCECTASAASLRWLHDGAPLPAPAATGRSSLRLPAAARHHQGMYQCIAHLHGEYAQAAAELHLAEWGPELVYTFIEQALRGGGSAALRCAAAGAPLPQVTWLRDGRALDLHAPRYHVSSERGAAGALVSTLNISALSVADGGRYACRAVSALGAVEHAARLNVYGPPLARAPGAVHAVAGDNLTLHCAYAGYPISSVTWRRVDSGASALAGGARVAVRGGALELAPALPADAGRYACTATAPSGDQATAYVTLHLANPPKISPFMFSPDLTEGSTAQALCGVSSGDKPLYFSWFKDGLPLPPELHIEEKSLNDFSLLMFGSLSARHSGAYTCRVANHAAAANYSATLTVKVPPSWVSEPSDAELLLGAPLLLRCAVAGHPPPTLVWYQRIESGTVGEQWRVVGTEGSPRAVAGALSARAAARSHQGRYRCAADNGVPPALEKQINITVHEPAHFPAGGDNVSAVAGRDAALSCAARGDPPLAVRWARNGATLDAHSERWSVKEERATEGGVRSVLTVRGVRRMDAGVYSCRADNAYGRVEALYYLSVEQAPSALESVSVQGVGSRWVRVQWRVVGAAGAVGEQNDGTAAVRAELTPLRGGAAPLNRSVQREPEPGCGVVRGLQPGAAYWLRLAAENRVGSSPLSDPVLATTLEEAPGAPPRDVRARPLDSGDLHVSWLAPPTESWNGEVVGYAVRCSVAGRASWATVRGAAAREVTIRGVGPGPAALHVRAFTRAGAGPPSPDLLLDIPDTEPQLPPEQVRCEATDAGVLRVRWSAPRADAGDEQALTYDVMYLPVHLSDFWSESERASAGSTRSVSARGLSAELSPLLPRANYSVWVRARSPAGAGPPAPPVHCTTMADYDSAVRAVRAGAAAGEARACWLPPPGAPPPAHYTLHARTLGRSDDEWSVRVERGAGEVVCGAVRAAGGAALTVWVRAHQPRAAPASQPVTVSNVDRGGARVLSPGRVLCVARGSRVRLRCVAAGNPPLLRRWDPHPPQHSLTTEGDLVIHEMDRQWAGNYTCWVNNAAGADSVTHAVRLRAEPPAPPPPRLARAAADLQLAWTTDHMLLHTDPVISYTLWWALEPTEDVEYTTTEWEKAARAVSVAPGERRVTLRGLACGARYRVTLQTHNAHGASPHSRALVAHTAGDSVEAPLAGDAVWSNSSSLRVNLLAWRAGGARCPVLRWSVALRPAGDAAWRALTVTDDPPMAEAVGLTPGTWYEVSVEARAAAHTTRALYRVPTLTVHGERVGEASVWVGAARGAIGGGALLPSLGAAAGLALVLAAAVLARQYRERKAKATADPARRPPASPPPKRDKLSLSLASDHESLHEISPYATFVMGARGPAPYTLHVSRAHEALALAAPPRPAYSDRSRSERVGSVDSSSESSGSSCSACRAPPRAPHAPPPRRDRPRHDSASHRF